MTRACDTSNPTKPVIRQAIDCYNSRGIRAYESLNVAPDPQYQAAIKLMKSSIVIVILAVVSLTLFYIITWTGSDEDLTPYIRGDYAAAVNQFREAAEQGDAAAQYNLALMYGNGKGVPQDDTEAMKWYSRSAEQGYAYAQYNLSMVYYFGQGVPQDYVAAYKWLILAADQGEDHAKEALPMLAKKMAPEQITEAEAAAQAWREKNRQPVL